MMQMKLGLISKEADRGKGQKTTGSPTLEINMSVKQ